MRKLLLPVVSVLLMCSVSFGEDALWSKKIASSIISRFPDGYKEPDRTWNYVVGAVLRGFQELYDDTKDSTYLEFIQKSVDIGVDSNGNIFTQPGTPFNPGRGSLDDVCTGTSLLYLYKHNKAEKYKTAASHLRAMLDSGSTDKHAQRTSGGGFWHRVNYTSQMWLDGIYMAEPFYCNYTVIFDESNPIYLRDVWNQFALLDNNAKDPVTGLMYHAWDESGNMYWTKDSLRTGARPKNCSASFWGRAMGWYLMGLVDVLDYYPVDNPHRDSLLTIFKNLSKSLANYQDPEFNVWYNVTDYNSTDNKPVGYVEDSAKHNYRESSSSCMFTYCFLKGYRKGYLDSTFKDAGIKAFNGIIKRFVRTNGSEIFLDSIMKVGGLGFGVGKDRYGDFNYYMSENIATNDGKGVGPFLTAAIEYDRITQPNPIRHSILKTKGINATVSVIPIKNKVIFNIDNAVPAKIHNVKLFNLAGKVLTITPVIESSLNNQTVISYTVKSSGTYLYMYSCNGHVKNGIVIIN